MMPMRNCFVHYTFEVDNFHPSQRLFIDILFLSLPETTIEREKFR